MWLEILKGAASVASLVASGLGLWQAEKARGAEQERLDEIEAGVKNILPPNYDLNMEDPPELVMEELKRPEFAKELAKVKYNKDKLKLVGEYIPELTELIVEIDPTVIEDSEVMKRGMEAQEQALGAYEDIADSGYEGDPRIRALMARAKENYQGEAQSRADSLAQQMARRGVGGSGIELASQLASQGQAMDKIADLEMEGAGAAYQARLDALASGAELGGRMSRDDLSKQQINAQIVNDFNKRMSQRAMDQARLDTDAKNAAQLTNLQAKQRLAEQQLDRDDMIAEQEAEELNRDTLRREKQDALRYSLDLQDQERRKDDAWKRYHAKNEQQAKLNHLKRLQYEDEMSRYRASKGLSDQRGAADRQATQDRNQAMASGAKALTDTTDLLGKFWGDEEKEKEKKKKKKKDIWSNPYQPGIA